MYFRIYIRNLFLKFVIFITILFSITSCDSEFPSFKKTNSGIYYKYYKIGEKKKTASFNDFVTVNIKYKTLKDSIFFSAKRQFQILKPDYVGGVDQCFTMLSVGDSASFVLLSDIFFKKTLEQSKPSFLDSSEYFIVDIEMLNFISEQQFNKEKEEFLAWIEDFAIYEKKKLKNYLADCTNNYKMDAHGFYKLVIDKGDNRKVTKGDTLVLDYEGRFMNGKIFDSTIKRKRTFEYIYGTEWQVIKGMELAVSNMSLGEKSIFILPSSLAFGQDGNSNGTIPPYTTIIYEIKLLEIRR